MMHDLSCVCSTLYLSSFCLYLPLCLSAFLTYGLHRLVYCLACRADLTSFALPLTLTIILTMTLTLTPCPRYALHALTLIPTITLILTLTHPIPTSFPSLEEIKVKGNSTQERQHVARSTHVSSRLESTWVPVKSHSGKIWDVQLEVLCILKFYAYIGQSNRHDFPLFIIQCRYADYLLMDVAVYTRGL
jgi:hypothetical protein